MKRNLGILILIALVTVLAFAFAACDEEEAHVCNYMLVDTIEPTCVDDGENHYICKGCGAKKTENISCTNKHVPGLILDEKKPSCEESGFVSYECGVCGLTQNETLERLTHTAKSYEEVLPNCTQGGYTGGTYCQYCEMEMSARTELPPTGEHTSVAYPDVEPTCGTVGYTGGTYCSVCEITLTNRTEIPTQGQHSSAPYDDVGATCGTAGYTGGTYCTVCEKELTKRTEIPATGEHTETTVSAVNPTCTQVGLSAGKKCTVCEIFTVPQTEVPMIPHSYSYSVVTAPQYQVAGLGRYTCGMCADSYDKEIPALTYQPSDIWTGDTASGFESGDGTQQNPYIIKTAAQLKYFADQVNSGVSYNNQYIALDADIALNDTVNYMSWSKSSAPSNKWTPIGNSGIGFYGNFDGRGHTIFGVYVYQKKMSSGTNYPVGLFGNMSGGSIQNLTVADSYICSEHGAAGGIISYADASDSYITINNCHFKGTVISSGHAGGIVGTVRCGWVGHDYVGGSLSAVLHDGTLTISDCTASGKVASDSMMLPQNDCYVGGIAGNVYYACGTVTISGCTNYAEVTSKSHAGGIAGVLNPSDNNRDSVTFTITSCVNKGAVTANGNAGGIASRFQFLGKGAYYDAINISNCGNIGTIMSYAEGRDACVGGIFGDIRTSGTQYCDIYGLYNLGDIIVTGTAYNVGGISGGLSLETTMSTPKFRNSFNSGSITVTGASNVGGLFGYAYASWQRPFTLEVCYNEGDVTSSGQNVGGLFGNMSNAAIKDCYNLGNITGGDKKVGGLVGSMYSGSIKTSFNAGNVSGTGVYVGAIVGQNDNASVMAFFKEGCATDGKGKVQGMSGSDRNTAGDTYNSLNEAAMHKSSSYKAFDYTNVWNEPTSDSYPTLKNVVKAPTEE